MINTFSKFFFQYFALSVKYDKRITSEDIVPVEQIANLDEPNSNSNFYHRTRTELEPNFSATKRYSFTLSFRLSTFSWAKITKKIWDANLCTDFPPKSKFFGSFMDDLSVFFCCYISRKLYLDWDSVRFVWSLI